MEHPASKWNFLKTSAARWAAGYCFVLLCGVGLVYYWRVAYRFDSLSPGLATAIVCAGFSAVYLAVFLCAHFLKQNLPLKAGVLVLLAALCFAAANPPLQAPDETMHFARAYSFGSGNFLLDQNEDYPQDVDALFTAFPGFYQSEVLAKGGPELPEAYAAYRRLVDSGEAVPNAATSYQQLFAYLPPAAGVAAGRLFGADALTCLYLARAANALCYAALCAMAVYLAGRFVPLLLALMLSPIALFIAGSASADGLYLGCTWLFIGACLSPVVTKKRLAALVGSFALLYVSKPTSLALLPLCFLLPFTEGKTKKGRRLRPAVKSGAAIAGGVGAALVLSKVFGWYVALASNYGRVAYNLPGIDPTAQFKFVLSNPVRYLAVFCYSLYRDKANLFSLGAFGWMDMNVEFVNYFAPLVLLFAAALCALEAAREPPRTGWLLALTGVLFYGVTYSGMYLTSTPVTLAEINGVQTRYLLGAFFALFGLAAILLGRTMALQELRPGKPQKTPPAWRMLHLSFCFAVVSALLLFQKYYIGP